MKKFLTYTTLFLLVLVSAAAGQALQSPNDETRYCATPTTVVRDPDGSIHRSATVIRHFRLAHPCPVTGLTIGACAGWSIDHVVPLECGGCDAVFNMQWLPNTIKSCAGTECKDRWEKRVYCKTAM